MTKTLTVKEATEKWVGEFNRIPLSLIEKAYPNMEDIHILSTEKECSNCGNNVYELNDEKEKVCDSCDEVHEFYDVYGFPMWGTVWTFGDGLDDDWIRKNLDVVADCGIWVYESEELGIFFGIDGAGYDFYENHWIPLYEARGLKWHTEKEVI